MKNKILKNCPICGDDLVISKLKCTGCEMEYSGNFRDSSFFSKFDDEEMDFIKAFLKNEGNISKMQSEIGKTYAGIKSKLNEINIKLGTVKEKKECINMGAFENVKTTEIGDVIKKKLMACGGTAKMQMLKGAPLDIWLSPSGEGIENSGFGALVCEWKILEAIVKKANELGGIMYRGDSASQSGEKIGSPALPLDTIDAFISVEFYGATVGSTTLRRSTYYAAILAWAGIVENHRSNGKGGYIIVKPQFRV